MNEPLEVQPEVQPEEAAMQRMHDALTRRKPFPGKRVGKHRGDLPRVGLPRSKMMRLRTKLPDDVRANLAKLLAGETVEEQA